MSILLGQGFSFNSFISNFSTHYNSEWPISLLVVKKKTQKDHKHDSFNHRSLSLFGKKQTTNLFTYFLPPTEEREIKWY